MIILNDNFSIDCPERKLFHNSICTVASSPECGGMTRATSAQLRLRVAARRGAVVRPPRRPSSHVLVCYFSFSSPSLFFVLFLFCLAAAAAAAAAMKQRNQ